MTPYTIEKWHDSRKRIIKCIANRDIHKTPHNYEYITILQLSRITPNIKAHRQCEHRPQFPSARHSRATTFPARIELTLHLKRNTDCDIIDLIHKSTPISSPKPSCAKWCANTDEMGGRLKYHPHITPGGRGRGGGSIPSPTLMNYALASSRRRIYASHDKMIL